MGKVQVILTKPGADHVKLQSFKFEIFRFEKTTFYTKKLLYYGNILRRLTELIKYVESNDVANAAEIEKAGFWPEEIRDYLNRPEFFRHKHRRLNKIFKLVTS